MMKYTASMDIALVSADHLAQLFGFSSPNESFRNFCRRIDVQPIRRNPNYFDAKLVRYKLDAAQGLANVGAERGDQGDLIAQRRARRAAQ